MRVRLEVHVRILRLHRSSRQAPNADGRRPRAACVDPARLLLALPPAPRANCSEAEAEQRERRGFRNRLAKRWSHDPLPILIRERHALRQQ